MIPDVAIACVIIGVLFYKALELMVTGLKLRQAALRGLRAIGVKPTSSGNLYESFSFRRKICSFGPQLSRPFACHQQLVASLDANFTLVVAVYILVALASLGFVYVLLSNDVPYRTSFLMSVLSIMTSLLVAILNLIIEKFRALVEQI